MELGRRLVAPLITEFRGNFPDVQVHLVLSDSGVDVIDDGLDVALRNGLPSDSSVIAKKVLTAKRITCASPGYFKAHGTPAKPGDLLQHDCIRLVRGRQAMDAWVFQEQGKHFEVVVNGTLTTTSGEVVHDWVRAGKGIALKADWDLQAELREGSIVHTERDACVYIRQSSMQQVRTRPEGQRRQYDLRERAQALGFHRVCPTMLRPACSEIDKSNWSRFVDPLLLRFLTASAKMPR